MLSLALISAFTNYPVQAHARDKQDVRGLRIWFVNASKRSNLAGFDLICLYGAHGFEIFQHLFSSAANQRSYEHRASLENWSRFVNEVVSDVQDAIWDTIGLTLRVSLDESIGNLGFSNGEVRDFLEMNNNLLYLWDLAQGAWKDCSGPSRFVEDAQETLVHGIHDLTDRPSVGVGRFISPDLMVRMIKSGVLNMIGYARPLIADTFLLKKVEEGRIDYIHEFFGSNICITGDMTLSIS